MHLETPEGQIACELRTLVVAGWTGRDRLAVNDHIEELARIGVPRPSTVPLFYEVSPGLATQSGEIAVLGDETSGEVEPVLIRTGGRHWLGLGSDHTDRWLETRSVAHSKQACAKIIGRTFWPFEAMAGFLDEVALSCRIDEDTLYQDGRLSSIRPLDDLLASRPLDNDEAMLCGTLPAIGGVRPARRYLMAMEHEALGSIELQYRVRILPIAG